MAVGVPEAEWSDVGGIVALADLIDAHRAAFEYDWRNRFGTPLREVGRSMAWGEALRMTGTLAADPSSQVGAALNEWDYPVSWDAVVAMNHYDLVHQIAWAQGGGKGSRPKPHPRPWDKSKTFGSRVADVASVLAAHRAAIDATRPT